MAKVYTSIAGNEESKIYSEEVLIQGRDDYSSSSSVSPSSYVYPIKSIRICNTHATDSVSIDLAVHQQETENAEYLEYQRKLMNHKGSPGFNDWTPVELTINTYMLLNNVVIPNGVTLVLDEKDIAYDTLSYYLTIQLSALDSAVDIIIN